MPEFSLTGVEPPTYRYAEGRATMDQNTISEAVGGAFEALMDFQEAHGAAPDGPPLSVCDGCRPGEIAFRAGLLVSEADAKAVAGDVKAGQTPDGEARHFTLVRPYVTLRDDQGLMMEHMAAQGLTPGAPTSSMSSTPRPRASTACGPRSTSRWAEKGMPGKRTIVLNAAMSGFPSDPRSMKETLPTDAPIEIRRNPSLATERNA